MKQKYLLFGVFFVLFLSTASAYRLVCFDRGDTMFYEGVACNSDCCQVCVTDTNYQAAPQSCIDALGCQCDGIPGNTFECQEQWDCSEWGACGILGTQTRTCTDVNACGTEFQRPIETQTCYSEPQDPELLARIEALENRVSLLESLVGGFQAMINEILALLGTTPEGCAFNNPACDSGYACEDNVCVEMVGCAYDNPSCAAGELCVDNACVTETPAGCEYNNPACSAGQQCVSNVCVPLIGCSYNNPACDPGYQCVNNACVEIVSEDEVIFRTNVASGTYWSTSGEIVFDYDKDGDMDCLKYSTYYKYYTNSRPTILAKTPEGYEVHKYMDGALVKVRDNYIFTLSTGCQTPLTKVPVEPYSSNNQEVLKAT